MITFNSKKSPTTIKNIALVSMFVSIILCTMLLWGYEYFHLKKDLLERKTNEARIIAHSLAIAVKAMKEKSSVQRILAAMAAQREVKGIYLVNGDNNIVLAASENKLIGKKLPENLSDILRKKQFIDYNNEEVWVTLPMLIANSFAANDISANSIIIFQLLIPGFIYKLVASLLIQLLCISLALLLSFEFLYLFLCNGIIGPVNTMIDTIKKRESGDGRAFSRAEGNSEIAALSRGFDSFLSTNDRLIAEKNETEKKLICAKNAAVSANNAKSSFVAMIGHEIRTPLHSIMGYADVLNESIHNNDHKKFVKSIQVASDMLLSQINDLLDFSKIEAGKLDLEIVDFNLIQVVKEAIDFCMPHADQKKIELTYSVPHNCPITVKGDPLRLRQIILNLVSNAIKFTDQGEVVVRIMIVEKNNENIRLRLEVQDTGVGLTIEEQSHLFHPFTQADLSISRKYGGTGLGLTICRKLVELMKGIIEIESTPGKGSTFIIELNLLSGSDASVALERPACNDYKLKKQYILVAEDNVVNQQMMSIILEKNGHKVDIVSNGQEAVDAVKKTCYDLVLMDIQMPVMDGLEATRQIRALDILNNHLPIIAMTANAYTEDMKKCFSAGMDDFLPKPVHIDILNSTIGKWGPSECDIHL